MVVVVSGDGYNVGRRRGEGRGEGKVEWKRGWTYISPRDMEPAIVYFSRLGMCKSQTMIQGKMAKKKSTRIVDTQRMYEVGRVSMGQYPPGIRRS